MSFQDLIEATLLAAVIGVPLVALFWAFRRYMLNEVADERAPGARPDDDIEKAELKARVQTLERIVTDKGFDVSEQIEQLREPREQQPIVASGRDEAVN